jgi:tRNA(fMet)-specific endonuclease VapC
MRYLLDTNVISEFITKIPNARVLAWLDSLAPNDVYLSAISIGELSKGIEKLPVSKRKEDLHKWLHSNVLPDFAGRILSLDVEVMLTWGVLTARLERQGKPLPAIDSLIAAIAIHHHCVLITRNDHDFESAGISVMNPWKAVS